MFMRGGPPHGAMFLFGLSQLFWIIMLIFLACLLVRWITTRRSRWLPFQVPPMPGMPGQTANVPPAPHPGMQQPSALEILNRRYASGEIDAATFEHMRERIIGSQPSDQA
jgi:uncharacterized membrane protein